MMRARDGFDGRTIQMRETDPIVGIWGFNAAKSKWPPAMLAILRWQSPPKEAKAVYRQINAEVLEYIGAGTFSDGSSISNTYTFPSHGGIAKRQPPLPEGASIVKILISPGEWYVTFLRNGKQSTVIHKIVSKDGKTLCETTIGTDPQGESFEAVSIYDRQ
jgi:hypothetical protein